MDATTSKVSESERNAKQVAVETLDAEGGIDLNEDGFVERVDGAELNTDGEDNAEQVAGEVVAHSNTDRTEACVLDTVGNGEKIWNTN